METLAVHNFVPGCLCLGELQMRMKTEKKSVGEETLFSQRERFSCKNGECRQEWERKKKVSAVCCGTRTWNRESAIRRSSAPDPRPPAHRSFPSVSSPLCPSQGSRKCTAFNFMREGDDVPSAIIRIFALFTSLKSPAR